MAEEFSDEECDTSLNDKVFNKMQSDMRTEGFRSGLSAGQEENVQKGFNVGYRRALSESRKLSKLRGMLTAILCHNMLVERESGTRREVSEAEGVAKEVDNKVAGKDTDGNKKVIDVEKVKEIENMIELLSEAEKSLIPDIAQSVVSVEGEMAGKKTETTRDSLTDDSKNDGKKCCGAVSGECCSQNEGDDKVCGIQPVEGMGTSSKNEHVKLLEKAKVLLASLGYNV